MKTTFYCKAGVNDLDPSIITSYQKACKERGYQEVAFYHVSRDFPWLTVDVDEDCTKEVELSKEE